MTSKGIFLEWSLTATIIVYFHSMSIDVEKFKYVYEFGRSGYEDEMIGEGRMNE